MKTFRMNVISLGVAEIRAKTKAEAKRRARAGDYDSYELEAPNVAITSLAEGEPVNTALSRRPNDVVFRWKAVKGLLASGGKKLHASRDCPSIRGLRVEVVDVAEFDLELCSRPACAEAFAKGGAT